MTIKVTYNVTDVYVTQDVSPVYINVSYSGGGSGGAAVWGGITGTLSNQTDLQNALNAKFDDPTGTTSQYLRGDGSLATFPAIPSGTVSSVGLTMPSAFSVANSPITSSGTLAVTATGDTTQYIAGDGSLVAFPITGQAGTLVREVRNVTGATLTKGTVVYINGASGNKPTVAKALATGDATSAQTFGLIQADIPNNSNGYLVAFGDLDGLNTSAFAEGVQLYLSSTTAGGYTSTKQYAPNHLVYIGVVTRQHVNQGRIEVRIQNGYELDELHDVAAQTPSNNDGIFYNSSNSLWENKSIATALGYTPANAATTLTINGVTFDLSANRTFTVGSVTGSGASGQVAYWDGTTSQAGSNNLFWRNVDGYLGLGTTNPLQKLHIVDGAIQLTDAYPIRWGTSNLLYGSTTGLDITNTSFAVRFRFTTGGNLLVNTTTDNGQRLQVQGTTLLNGNVTFSSATGMFWDASNSRLGIGTNAPSGIWSGNNRSIQITAPANFASELVLSRPAGAFGATSVTHFLSGAGVDLFGVYTASTTSNYAVYTNSNERLRIWTTGNVSIGAGNNPSDSGERLQVTGTMKVTATGSNNTTFANAGQAVYNTYAPTGYSSWIIGVETQYFLGYSGRNILVFSRDRNHTTGGIDNNYIGFGHLGPTANVDIASSSTARASLRIRSGTAPTSPNDGDIWFDGTDIKMRIGGVTKTFTLV